MGCCGHDKEIFEGRWYEHPLMRNALIAFAITGSAFALAHSEIISHTVENAMFLVAILIGGYHWSREAVEALIKEREIGIEFLMMSATVGCMILNLWDEAATLVVLYGAAEGLEEYTFARTRASIRKLLELAPPEARIRKDGQEIMIPAENVQVGDIFIVKPGESLPTDGNIIQGRSSIDEAPVTGESVPVEKEAGMKVFAGTINHDGMLEIQATTDFENNTLSKMVHLVEEAREQKAKTQQFIEAFGEKYSPAVFVVAILVMAIPPLFGAPFIEWATRAIVMLVAAAPCALVMSTPVAIAAGIGSAGRNGVLIKGGMHLESLGKLKGIAFDKTGTLTKGKPQVSDVITLEGDEHGTLQLALSLEKSSTHPLAKAIVSKAEAIGIQAKEVEAFRSLTGAGVQGKIDNQVLYIGKPKLFEEMGVKPDPQVEHLSKEGKTVVLLGTQEKILGIIAIQDTIRAEAKQVIDTLHQMGMKVAMLTGDNQLAANAIAAQLGIDDVRAELKPEDKITAIEELEKKYGPMAMVGDGINDAPALARATLGIAMGTAGTDAAIEAADTALMGDDLTKVVYALHLGRKARAISRQNIIFSLLLLAVLIPSALLGWITVAIAVLFHEAAELIAVANGLRVARRPKMA
ncbi:MAG: cadmium-translocating P-type ATPase [Cyanobacteria bacterium]|nr:cadmium-translocating P-type ATPase [Cyanobacteriota bacterium]